MEQINSVLREFFQEGSHLSALVDNYKYRSDQVQLADVIYKTFEDKEFLVAEAGTGVGKTYAYLVPAVLWTFYETEKVVISTKTKTLQQQLTEKDLPNIIKILGVKIKFAEAKGRDNYLCWNKYMKILSGRREMSSIETDFIEKILGWAEKTKTGDKKELTLKYDLMSHWKIVAADRNSCEKDACRYHDKCFRLKMMKSLEKADIIIVNHALLLSDIMVDNSILPPYKYLIIDEAHNIDREAFSRLSNRVTFSEFYDVLRSLYNKSYNKGHLSRLKKEMPERRASIDECILLIDRTEQLLIKLQNSFKKLLWNVSNEHITSILNEELLEKENFTQVYDSYVEVIELLNHLVFQMEDLQCEDNDFIIFFSMLKELTDILFMIMEEDLHNSSSLVWLEWKQGEIDTLSSSIIEIGSVLYESLYNKLDSLILLSATITVDDKFDFFINKTGLNTVQNNNRLNTFSGQSPFCYEKQAQLLVLNDLPQPDSFEFTKEVTAVLKEIIRLTKGRTLVLFTARKQMKTCADELRPFLHEHNIDLLVQNEDGEAISILNSFISQENSILMGLDSFWEGIDLKGDLLSYLVIVKLPFKAPNDPLSSAYDKYCRVNGLNTFNTFSLPDAIMRFKQGIGRLIRSESDKGVVIVLDNRLHTKRYGLSFRKSIPIKNVLSIDKLSLKSFL